MIEIIPAIMPRSFSEVEEKMSLVQEDVSFVQIDVMDATITKDATWPYLLPDADIDFQNIITEKTSMPCWDSLSFEADLMVKNPERITQDWLKAGAGRIIFHIESEGNVKEFVQSFRLEGITKDSPLYVELGLAITADADMSLVESIIPHIDFVQCMGIKTIGVQGSPFDERILQTISTLKNKFPSLVISVDGGVTLETAPRLIQAGAKRLVSGSTIYRSEDVKEIIEKLKHINK